METERKIRLFVCEDSQVICLGIKAMLNDMDFEVVGQAHSGEECLKKVLECRPDIILMDVRMPGMSGIECTQRVKSALPEVRVLILTSSEDVDTMSEALSAGADGYCLKSAGLKLLLSAIETLANGAMWIDRSAAKLLVGRNMTVSRLEETQPELARKLTSREVEVLQLLVRGNSNIEIGAELYLSPQTVKTHVRHIMEKLQVTDRTQAAVKAVRAGIVIFDEAQLDVAVRPSFRSKA